MSLGITLHAQGKLDEAVAEYREAVRLRPEDPMPKNGLADLLANHADPTRRDPAAAVVLATGAVGLDAKAPSYRNTLGQAYVRAGQLDAAMEALQASMQMSGGGDAEDWYFVAMVHARQGRPVEARRWLDRANAWVEKDAPGDVRFGQFRAEAEASIATTGGPGRPQGR